MSLEKTQLDYWSIVFLENQMFDEGSLFIYVLTIFINLEMHETNHLKRKLNSVQKELDSTKAELLKLTNAEDKNVEGLLFIF